MIDIGFGASYIFRFTLTHSFVRCSLCVGVVSTTFELGDIQRAESWSKKPIGNGSGFKSRSAHQYVVNRIGNVL